MEDENYKHDLPRPPSVFGRPARTRQNYIQRQPTELKESDNSDASTETNRFQVIYEYIARHTPLPFESEDKKGAATDTVSKETDHIANEYSKENEELIWI